MVEYYSQIGNGLKFFGTDDYLETGNNTTLNLKSNQAVSFEFVISYSGTGNGTIISNRGGTPSRFNVAVNPTNLAIIYIGDGDFPSTYSSKTWDLPYTLTGDQLIHIIITKPVSDNPATWKAFANGVELNSVGAGTSGTPFSETATATTRVGVERDNRFFEGTLYLLRLYNKELSSSEVSALFDGQLPTALKPSLLLNYDFNYDRGATVWDKSGNGNHGTAISFGSTTDKNGGAWRDIKGIIV